MCCLQDAIPTRVEELRNRRKAELKRTIHEEVKSLWYEGQYQLEEEEDLKEVARTLHQLNHRYN